MGRRRRTAGVAALAAVFVLTLSESSRGPTSVDARITDALDRLVSGPWLDGHPRMSDFVGQFIEQITFQGYSAFHAALYGAMLAVAVGLAVRAVARARLRQGRSDPLDALRSRPGIVRAVAWVPAALWAVIAVKFHGNWLFTSDWLWSQSDDHPGWMIAAWALATGVYAVGLRALAGFGMRGLLDPVGEERGATPAERNDEITFSAVAVTARTRGAVAALALASAGMVAWVSTLSLTALVDHPGLMAVLAAYVAAAAGAAAAFRRTSRIVVGIDGLRAGHAFHAYRDLDEARARGADLELVRRGRVVLRLQMHSDDAGRRDEVLARLGEAIRAARSVDTRGAAAVVQAMPSAKVASASVGGQSYRFPALSREQLWELVEGPTTDATTRTAAAEVLAVGLDDTDRSRLRVAAARSAEPRVRVALEALVWEDHDDHEEDEVAAASGAAPTTLQ
jgi:hypothetical protein